jgi:transcriptional regulator with XRE-family HTH domain
MGFYENLKLQLAYSGMPVKELAELSGVKKATIDSYLNYHRRMPSADAALRLARALGVTVEQLFGASPEPSPHAARERAHIKEEKLAAQARKLARLMQDFADLLET